MANSLRNLIEKSTLFSFDPTTGEVIPQTSDVLSAVKDMMKSIFGANLVITDESPAGRLSEAIAIAVSRFAAITASYANQINPEYATGQMLDAIGSVFSVVRTGATPTIIACEFSGDVGTVIPTGSVIGNSRGLTFSVQDTVTIPEGGTATGRAVCDQPGVVTVENETITNIEKSIIGWSTVKNTGTIRVGSDIESDLHFRQRILLSRWTGTAFVDSIHSEIERLDGVDSVVVVENVYSANMYLAEDMSIREFAPEEGKYLMLKPHSICAIVHGETLQESDNAKIADAIHKTKSAGCGFTALDEETQIEQKGHKIQQSVVDSNSGVSYDIIFNKPLETHFGVNVTVAKNRYAGTPEKLTEDVKNAIDLWVRGDAPFVDGLALGQNVISYEIGAAISDVIPSIQIKKVELTHGEGFGETTQEIDIFVNEIGILEREQINVTVV